MKAYPGSVVFAAALIVGAVGVAFSADDRNSAGTKHDGPAAAPAAKQSLGAGGLSGSGSTREGARTNDLPAGEGAASREGGAEKAGSDRSR